MIRLPHGCLTEPDGPSPVLTCPAAVQARTRSTAAGPPQRSGPLLESLASGDVDPEQDSDSSSDPQVAAAPPSLRGSTPLLPQGLPLEQSGPAPSAASSRGAPAQASPADPLPQGISGCSVLPVQQSPPPDGATAQQEAGSALSAPQRSSSPGPAAGAAPRRVGSGPWKQGSSFSRFRPSEQAHVADSAASLDSCLGSDAAAASAAPDTADNGAELSSITASVNPAAAPTPAQQEDVCSDAASAAGAAAATPEPAPSAASAAQAAADAAARSDRGHRHPNGPGLLLKTISDVASFLHPVRPALPCTCNPPLHGTHD